MGMQKSYNTVLCQQRVISDIRRKLIITLVMARMTMHNIIWRFKKNQKRHLRKI